ncbi:carbohydrate porin [Paraburkholderia sediminicola]|uniref:carbohydrate porin n=1 Tax=Paraburkholderia sediminicola TaxID=458836 RepID=UPI0038B89B95
METRSVFKAMRVALIFIVAQFLASTPYAESSPSPGFPPQFELPPGMPDMTPGCLRYDQLASRSQPDALTLPTCDTLFPEMGGVRAALADNGIGFEAASVGNFYYDLLGHNAHPQLYAGQDPTWGQQTVLNLTYDLSRVGFTPGAQLVIGANLINSDFTVTQPDQATMWQFVVNQPLYDGRVVLQYGYYSLLNEFYGLFLGASPTSSALGPLSIIPSEVGMSMLTPTPGMSILIKDPSKHFYTHFAIARSQSPGGLNVDVAENPTGFRLTVPGARMLFVNEFGYRSTPQEGHEVDLRIGAIYNFSHFSQFTSPHDSSSNYGGYVNAKYQITQPYAGMPEGLYANARFDYAPPDRNLFTSDMAFTLYYLGPFKGRPLDMVSLAYSKTFFSKDARTIFGMNPGGVAANSTGISLSYAARVIRGVYFINTLTYTKNPTVTPRSPNSLVLQTSVAIGF